MFVVYLTPMACLNRPDQRRQEPPDDAREDPDDHGDDEGLDPADLVQVLEGEQPEDPADDGGHESLPQEQYTIV